MSQRYTSAISTAASVNFVSSGAHTLAGWVFLQTNTSQQDICYGDDAAGGGGNNLTWMGVDNGFARFNVAVGGVTVVSNGSSSLSLNAWHHLALTYSGSGVFHKFVDGVDGGPISASVAGRPNFNYFDIGYPGDMTVQDIFWINAELSAAQILQLMRQPSAFTASAYAAYALTNAAPTVDASGNGHTLSGGGDSNGTQILIYPATATTNVTGSAVVTSATGFAIAAAGQVRTTGVSALTAGASAAGSGLVRVSGSSALAATAALAGSGVTQVSGAASVTSGAAGSISAGGLVSVSGTAVVTGGSSGPGYGSIAKRFKQSRRGLSITARRRNR